MLVRRKNISQHLENRKNPEEKRTQGEEQRKLLSGKCNYQKLFKRQLVSGIGPLTEQDI